MTDLGERIERLEAESAIRRLKAAYLNACDAKDVGAIRACFADDAMLDFPPVGTFGVDGMVSAFETIAVGTPIVDVHQAHNGEIVILDQDHATARWNLGFATFDPRTRQVRIIASFYHDRYRRIGGRWYIASSRHEPRAIVDGVLAEAVRVDVPQSTSAQ